MRGSNIQDDQIFSLWVTGKKLSRLGNSLHFGKLATKLAVYYPFRASTDITSSYQNEKKDKEFLFMGIEYMNFWFLQKFILTPIWFKLVVVEEVFVLKSQWFCYKQRILIFNFWATVES